MSQNIEGILRDIKDCPAAGAFSRRYENEGIEVEEIIAHLYENRDEYGETITFGSLIVLKENGRVFCFIKGPTSHLDREPCDKSEAKLLLGKKIEEAEEILKTLKTAMSWLTLL